jgi:hypothetical protein
MKRFVVLVGLAVVACGPRADPKVIAANEAEVMSEMRAVISAQSAYASSNYGANDELRCLSAPHKCIPGYPETAPHFLDANLAGLAPAHGYVRKFHPGLKADGVEPKRSPSSLKTWAYTAVPETPGITGKRAFCADATGGGWLCAVEDGKEPAVTEGKCPSTCGPAR